MVGDEKKLSEEFAEFMSSEGVAPPERVVDRVTEYVRRDLNPSSKDVFAKVLGIHALVSVVSLSLCSQFGLQTLALFDLMSVFMKFMGHTYCMALCGAVFMGASGFTFSLLLRPEEIRVVRQHRWLQVTALSSLSLGVFLLLDAEVLILPGALWMLGTLLGGIAYLELGWRVRSWFRQRLVYGI